MVVVASIGNSGADGLYSAGAPGVGDKVIGTASYDNSHTQQTIFPVSPDNLGDPVQQSPRLRRRHRRPAPADGEDGHSHDGGRRLHGRPGGHRCRQGGADPRGLRCSFYVKAFNAQSAGAAAVVLYNNVAGALQPDGCRPTADHDPGRRDHGRRRCAPERPDRVWSDHAHVDQRNGDVRQPDGWADLVVQLLRHDCGPDPEARHRGAGRPDPLDLPARAGRVRDDQRHVDGLPARCGRRGAAEAGSAWPRSSGLPGDPAEQRGSEELVRRSRARPPRLRASARGRHGRHRRRNRVDDDRDARQALVR